MSQESVHADDMRGRCCPRSPGCHLGPGPPRRLAVGLALCLDRFHPPLPLSPAVRLIPRPFLWMVVSLQMLAQHQEETGIPAPPHGLGHCPALSPPREGGVSRLQEQAGTVQGGGQNFSNSAFPCKNLFLGCSQVGVHLFPSTWPHQRFCSESTSSRKHSWIILIISAPVDLLCSLGLCDPRGAGTLYPVVRVHLSVHRLPSSRRTKMMLFICNNHRVRSIRSVQLNFSLSGLGCLAKT